MTKTRNKKKLENKLIDIATQEIKGNLKKKDVTEALVKMSKKQGYTLGTLRSYLSNTRRKIIEESEKKVTENQRKVDDSIEEFSKTKPEELPVFSKSYKKSLPTPPYEIDQLVNCDVSAIHDYGIFANIVGSPYSGLLHYENIAENHGSDLYSSLGEYFYKGQSLKLKVKEIKKDNKISFCAYHLDILSKKPLSNSEPLLKIRNQLEALPSIEKKEKETVTSSNFNQPNMDKEFQTLIRLLSQTVGTASDKCENLMRDLIDKHGVVSVTVAVMQNFSTFNPDLSYHFAKEVEKTLAGDSL